MTLKAYYKAYGSLLGVLAGLVSASPLLSLAPGALGKYIYPPLGIVDLSARLVTASSALLATYVVYFVDVRRRRKAITVAAFLFLLFAALYLISYVLFVRTVSVRSENSSVTVSVGFERSDFAKRYFADSSDEDVLRYRTTQEEEIRHCWTMRSILIARGMLWTTCTLAVVSLVATFGLGILESMSRAQSP